VSDFWLESPSDEDLTAWKIQLTSYALEHEPWARRAQALAQQRQALDEVERAIADRDLDQALDLLSRAIDKEQA
jgi:hypothetical protein